MSFRRSLAWGFFGQFATFIISFGASLVIARLLTPREVGIYVVAMAVVGVVQIVGTFGVSTYMVREAELDEAVFDTALTVNLLIGVIVSCGVFVVSLTSSQLLGDPAVGRVLRILALLPLIAVPTFRPSVMFQRAMRFRTISLINLGSAIVTSSSTIAAALSGKSYMSPAFGGMAGALFTTVAYLTVGRAYLRHRLSLAGWRPIATFGFQMISISGVAVLTARLSDIILSRILGLAALGLYSRASSLANMLFENLYGTATRVIFVQLSRVHLEPGRLRISFLRALSIITALMWPVSSGLAILARPAIHILYGDRWLGAAGPLTVLMIAQVIALAFGMNWELFVLKHETAKQTRYEIVRSVIGLTAFAVGSAFGLIGAALGRVFEVLTGLFLYTPHVRRLAETGPYEVPQVLARSFVLAICATAPAAILMIASDWSPATPPLRIAAAVLLGVALWLAALARMDHPLYEEIRTVLRRGGLMLRSREA